MGHFVAFHNSDKQGPFKRPLRAGQTRKWDTRKRYRAETIVGSRLWAIEGGGTPKRYRLLGSGIVTRLTPDKVHFRVDAHLLTTDVTDFRWFQRLRDEQRNFSYGLNKISGRPVIAALDALRREGFASPADERRPAPKTTIWNLADPAARIRQSPSAAAEILRQIVPKKHLTECLKAISHSVRLAHRAAPEKWGLRLNRNSIMLKVGFPEVLQLGDSWFHLLVKSDIVPLEVRAKTYISFNSPAYHYAPGCETCDVEDFSVVARVYPALLQAHEEAIRIAALSPRRPDTTKDHSPGLIIFLSQEAGALLPQPSYLEAAENAPLMPEEIPADQEFREGAAVQVLVNRYERDPAARERCIQHHGTTCVVCGISLAERYGPAANGLIHVHHLTPLADFGARSIVDPVRDLRPVCPNCHAVIHLTKPPRTIEQVKGMLRKQGAAGLGYVD